MRVSWPRLRAGALALLGAALLVVVALRATTMPPALQAATCTKSWAAAVSGLWTDGSKWAPAGAPAAGDDVCIGVDGTYTVTLDGTASVNSLTVGGGGNQQILALSVAAGAVSLTVANGLTNTATLTMARNGCCADASFVLTVTSGALVNSGTLNAIFDFPGAVTHTITADVQNSGTFNGGGLTLNRANGSFTNSGTWFSNGNPASSTTFSGNNQTFVNTTTGIVVPANTVRFTGVSPSVTSSGTLTPTDLQVTGGSVALAGGTYGGHVTLTNGALSIDNAHTTVDAGGSTLNLQGTSTFSGNVSANVMLNIQTGPLTAT